MGFEAYSGFDFTMEQKELLRKKMGYRSNSEFEFERNIKNCKEKRQGLDPMVDLIYKGIERIDSENWVLAQWWI